MANKRYGLNVLILLGLVLSALGLVVAVPRVVRAGDPSNGGHNYPSDLDDIDIYYRSLRVAKIRQDVLEFGTHRRERRRTRQWVCSERSQRV
jgi:hypothetical protein